MPFHSTVSVTAVILCEFFQDSDKPTRYYMCYDNKNNTTMQPLDLQSILMWITIISLVFLVAMTGLSINRFFIHRAHRRALAELHRRAFDRNNADPRIELRTSTVESRVNADR